MGMHVGVVDDEVGVREAVGYALEKAGYTVSLFRDGSEAMDAWREALPDLMVLDIIMPRIDGLELCRHVRTRSESTPVIFLSSKDEEIDRVLGLELGADDYLCKPFSVRELVARVRVLERRLRQLQQAASGESVGEGSALSHGDLALDCEALHVRWRGTPVPLTVTEFRLLETLVRNAGAVLSREQLLTAAYPDDVYVTERSIDSHIRRIRKKFEATGAAFEHISAVYGAGYRLARQVPA
jgi:two-component system response regulator ChvI